MTRVLLCPKCCSYMMFCFAIPGKEFVCPECGHGEEFYNGCHDKEIPDTEYEEWKEKATPKIVQIGLESGAYQ